MGEYEKCGWHCIISISVYIFIMTEFLGKHSCISCVLLSSHIVEHYFTILLGYVWSVWSPVLLLCLHYYQTFKLCYRFLCICGSEWEWNLSYNSSKWGKCYWFSNWISSCNRQYQPCLSPGNFSLSEVEVSYNSVDEDQVWSVTSCHWVSGSRYFKGLLCLHLQGLSNPLGPLNS